MSSVDNSKSPTVSASTQPPEKKKNGGKIAAIVIVVVILLVAIGLILYFLVFKSEDDGGDNGGGGDEPTVGTFTQVNVVKPKSKSVNTKNKSHLKLENTTFDKVKEKSYPVNTGATLIDGNYQFKDVLGITNLSGSEYVTTIELDGKEGIILAQAYGVYPNDKVGGESGREQYIYPNRDGNQIIFGSLDQQQYSEVLIGNLSSTNNAYIENLLSSDICVKILCISPLFLKYIITNISIDIP